jgi:hypothetical protein
MDMEQMTAGLLIEIKPEIRTSWEEIKVDQEEMLPKVETNQERMEAKI